LFLLLIILLWYSIKLKKPAKLINFTTSFPIVIYIIIMCFPEMIKKFSKELYNAFYYIAHPTMPDFAPITVVNYDSFISYMPLISSLLVIGCIVINLYYFFEKKSILPILIFLAGFCSRMIMSFSPSIYESAGRTYMLMYFSIIIIILMIYKELKKIDIKHIEKIQCYIMYGSVLPILNSIVNIITKQW